MKTDKPKWSFYFYFMQGFEWFPRDSAQSLRRFEQAICGPVSWLIPPAGSRARGKPLPVSEPQFLPAEKEELVKPTSQVCYSQWSLTICFEKTFQFVLINEEIQLTRTWDSLGILDNWIFAEIAHKFCLLHSKVSFFSLLIYTCREYKTHSIVTATSLAKSYFLKQRF
jgi:hypothetical protein